MGNSIKLDVANSSTFKANPVDEQVVLGTVIKKEPQTTKLVAPVTPGPTIMRPEVVDEFKAIIVNFQRAALLVVRLAETVAIEAGAGRNWERDYLKTTAAQVRQLSDSERLWSAATEVRDVISNAADVLGIGRGLYNELSLCFLHFARDRAYFSSSSSSSSASPTQTPTQANALEQVVASTMTSKSTSVTTISTKSPPSAYDEISRAVEEQARLTPTENTFGTLICSVVLSDALHTACLNAMRELQHTVASEWTSVYDICADEQARPVFAAYVGQMRKYNQIRQPTEEVIREFYAKQDTAALTMSRIRPTLASVAASLSSSSSSSPYTSSSSTGIGPRVKQAPTALRYGFDGRAAAVWEKLVEDEGLAYAEQYLPYIVEFATQQPLTRAYYDELLK